MAAGQSWFSRIPGASVQCKSQIRPSSNHWSRDNTIKPGPKIDLIICTSMSMQSGLLRGLEGATFQEIAMHQERVTQENPPPDWEFLLSAQACCSLVLVALIHERSGMGTINASSLVGEGGCAGRNQIVQKQNRSQVNVLGARTMSTGRRPHWVTADLIGPWERPSHGLQLGLSGQTSLDRRV